MIDRYKDHVSNKIFRWSKQVSGDLYFGVAFEFCE